VFELFEHKYSVIKIRNPNYFKSFLNKHPFKSKNIKKSEFIIQLSSKYNLKINNPYF